MTEYYGIHPISGPNPLIAAATAPFHDKKAVRLAHIALDIGKHFTSIPDWMRGEKKFSEIIHNVENFKAIYRQWTEPRWITDRKTGQPMYLSYIDEDSHNSGNATVDRVETDPRTLDLPKLAFWLNRLLNGQEYLVPKTPKMKKKAEEAWLELYKLKTQFVDTTVHNASLAYAENFFEEMNELHLGSLVNDMKGVAKGAGTGIVVSAALAALAVPIAAPIGVVAGAYAEYKHFQGREIPVVSDDGLSMELERYYSKDQLVAPGVLAQKIDGLLDVIQVPFEHLKIRERLNPNSPLSVKRAEEMGNVLIATSPNYYRIVKREIAYGLFYQKALLDEQTK